MLPMRSESLHLCGDALGVLAMVTPVVLQASAGRDLGSLNASDAGADDASRAGAQGQNGAADAVSRGDGPGSTRASVAAPSAGGEVAGSAVQRVVEPRDAGAALQEFAAMLSSKKRHYFMISNGGIPIYTRHGRPHDTASISALLYSIVSLSLDALGAPATVVSSEF